MSYYTQANPIREHTRARAALMNTEFQRIQSAFSEIPDYDELRGGSFTWGIELPSSTGVSYRVRTQVPPRTLLAGAAVRFEIRTTSTGAATLAVDGLAAAPLVQRDGRPLTASLLRAGTTVECVYDGRSWRVTAGADFTAEAQVFEELPADASLTRNAQMDAITMPQLVGAPAGTVYACAGLPSGLVFAADTRQITGTPTDLGEVTVTYSATVGGDTFSRTFVLTVVSAALVANAQRDILMVQGVAYTGVGLNRAVEGTGTAPYTYTLDNSQLPVGVNFDAETVSLVGTPTEAGSFRDVQLVIADSLWQTVTLTFDITVSPTTPVTLVPIPSIQAQVGVAINVHLDPALGGVVNYTYEARGLPAGLAFDPATRRITGSLARAGTYSFEYRVTDGAGSVAAQDVVIHVATAGMRYTAVVATGDAVTEAVLTGGRSFAVTQGALFLPNWVGQKKLVIAQPAALPDLTSIVLSSFGNSISAFTKEPDALDVGGVDYSVWVSNDVQGDVISGASVEVA